MGESRVEELLLRVETAILGLQGSVGGGTIIISDDGEGNVVINPGGSGSGSGSGSGTTTVAVTGVSFASASGSYTVGDTFILTPVIAPANATTKSGSWTISDNTVVSVSGTTFTALAAGSVTITFTTTDGGFTATYTAAVAGVSSNNFLNPESESMNWTRTVGEKKYLKVNSDGVGGLGSNNNYCYCGCFDITNVSLSGKQIVCNVDIRTLALTAGTLDSSYKKGADQTIGLVGSSDSSISAGTPFQMPTFDESVYTHLCITVAYASSILKILDGDKPLYLSTKIPYSSSDVDEYSA